MAIPAVTPQAGLNTIIAVGSKAVIVFPGAINGGFITNPPEATESLFVDAVTPSGAGVTAGGSTFEIEPGASWTAIPGQTTPTTANAVTAGHVFSAMFW